MKTIKTPIIPENQQFAKINSPHELNKEAICVFMATGFFLDEDTYWKDEVVLRPATINTIDDNGFLINSKPWFQWHYTPQDISFSDTLQQFTTLFETIVHDQVGSQKVILPLSGGLDSRTQAVALRNHPNISSYSYDFKGGYPETKIAKQISDKCNFPFQSFSVQKGYLWNCIEELAEINQCYSEFTHPRQMAIIDEFTGLGNIFSLGHWGDVLFDSFNLLELTLDEQVAFILKKIVVKGGVELASSLWESWGLEGDFQGYLSERIRNLLKDIDVVNTNAKLRAFKSMYWAPRWTSTNLSVFEKVTPISLPYYDDRMCEFICTVPEHYLANRQLQIAYVQRNAPDLAKITWQEHKPFNLTNYHLNKTPYNLPYRITNKLKREFNKAVRQPFVQRNWELQFIGEENDKQLKKWLFESKLEDLIPKSVIQHFYNNFKEKDAVKYSHPVSMLLTLALFQKKFC